MSSSVQAIDQVIVPDIVPATEPIPETPIRAKVLELKTTSLVDKPSFIAICNIVAMFGTVCENYNPKDRDCDFVFEVMHFPCMTNHCLKTTLESFTSYWNSLMEFDFRRARGTGNSIVNKRFNSITRNTKKHWNSIRNAVSISETDDELVSFFRDQIISVPFIKTTEFARENPCMVFETEEKPVQRHIPRSHELNLKRKNYDGEVKGIVTKVGRVYGFNTKRSCDLDFRLRSQGLHLDFDSREAFIDCIFHALHDVKPSQLTFDHSSMPSQFTAPFITRPSSRYGGGETIGINLYIRHNDEYAVIEHTSWSIVNLLLHKPVQKSRLDTHLRSTRPGDQYNTYYLRKYLERVNTVIRQKVHDSDLGITNVACHRTECGHEFLTTKHGPGILKEIQCPKCRRCEICTACNRPGHGEYDCDRLDEATQQEIASTSKPCPNCGTPIIKNDGCMHMTCRCGTHFCWACMTRYDLNEINDHRCETVRGVYVR